MSRFFFIVLLSKTSASQSILGRSMCSFGQFALFSRNRYPSRGLLCQPPVLAARRVAIHNQGRGNAHDQSTIPAGQSMSGDFAELADLWARRGDLSRDEWARLYQLVTSVLEANPVREEHQPALGGPGGVNALRQSFFVDKVLLPATAPGADPNPKLTLRALPVFYKRYLLDQLRAIQRHGETPLPEPDDGRMADPNSNNPFGWLGDTDCACQDGIEGIDSCALQDSARKFLRDHDDWVVIYLALHFCHGRERLPLSKIQRIYQIPSYHYKAVKLGIAPPRGGYAGITQFSDTMIGTWLGDNGIALNEDQRHIIRHAFDLLCLEAFAECDRRELADPETQR